MKKTLAVAGLGAAIAVGTLLGAGTASASEGSFVSAAVDDGWYNARTGATGLLNQGYQVCSYLSQGYSEGQIINWVYRNTGSGVGVADAGQFVALAEDHLC